MTELKEKIQNSRLVELAGIARRWLITIWLMWLISIITMALIKDGVIELVAVQLATGFGLLLSALALYIKSKFGEKK